MRKGLVLPIAGIIMFVISVVAVYVLAQQDGNFTKEIIFKGEVAASNLNELEMLRKMLPMAMEAMVERATFESAKDGYGKSSWGCVIATATCVPIIPTTDEIRQNLINEIIKIKKPTVGNYNRDITWPTPTITVTTDVNDLTYLKISGSFGFKLEDDIIKSSAESSIPISIIVTTSYFKLYEVGKSIFIVDSDEYNIINRNAPAWWKIEQLQTTLTSKNPNLNFLIEEVTNTELRITITDPTSLIPCQLGENECANSMKPLSTIFKITIPVRIIYDNKVNPLYLYVGPEDGFTGWNWGVKTPYGRDITAYNNDDFFGIVDYVIEIRNSETENIILPGDIMYIDTTYDIKVMSSCEWSGDYIP